MDHIPWGSLLASSACTGVMVSKTIEHPVPQWRKRLDQKLFAERYPNVIHDKATEREISQPKIPGLLDRFRMFAQSAVKDGSTGGSSSQATSSRSLWDGFTHIDWSAKLSAPVQCRDLLVGGEVTCIVNGIDPGSSERFRGRQRHAWFFKQRLRDSSRQGLLVERVEGDIRHSQEYLQPKVRVPVRFLGPVSRRLL